MTQTSRLGRGLSALIPKKDSVEAPALPSEPRNEVINLPLKTIVANPHQPRTRMNRHDLEDLVNSIKVHGIIQPVIVTPIKNGYQLIAGERRCQAARLLGSKNVPAIIRPSAENEQLEIALIENLQREDLNPIDRAQAFEKLMKNFGLNHEEIARKIGQSRSQITNTLRLLQLPDEIKNALKDGRLTEGHAKALLGLKTPAEQLNQFRKIIAQNLTVREAEVQTRGIGVRAHRRRVNSDPNIQETEELLAEEYGTKIKISKRGSHGRITLEFYSEEEYHSLVKRLIHNK